MSFNLSCTAQDLNAAVTKANAAAPQSTTYTKAEVNASQTAQNSEIGTLVDRASKNMIADTAFTGGTGNNVSCTVNSDGTATIKALSSAGASDTAFFTVGTLALPPGTYMLSGGASDSVWVYVPSSPDNWTSAGSAAEKTFSANTTVTVYVRVAQGFSDTTGVTVKPMICTKADWDMSNTYQPYAPTNRELYEMILAMQNGGNG